MRKITVWEQHKIISGFQEAWVKSQLYPYQLWIPSICCDSVTHTDPGKMSRIELGGSYKT